MIVVREAMARDRNALVAFRCDLWPDGTATEHDDDVAKHFAGLPRSTLPLTILIAVDGETPVGFVEVGLRSHADGCDPAHPVGFIEGWYVAPTHRHRGVGRTLIVAAESWSHGQGCREMASDTWSDSRGEGSVAAHTALGYEVTDRVVNFSTLR